MRRVVAALLSILALLLGSLPVQASVNEIAHPNQVLTATQSNQQERNARNALGTALRDLMGSSCATAGAPGCYDDITIAPGSGLYVTAAPTAANTLGSVYCPSQASDPNPMPSDGPTIAPSLPPDQTLITIAAHAKGASAPIGPLNAPTISEQSVYYLIEASCRVEDTDSSSQEFQDINGTAFTPLTVNTARRDVIVYAAKAGTAADSPSVPSVDTNSVALGTVLVPYGTTQITSEMIAQYGAYAGIPVFSEGTNIVLSGTATAPVISVISAPVFSGSVTAAEFDGSGAGLTSDSVPLSALASDTISGVSLGETLAALSCTSPLSCSAYTGASAQAVTCPTCAVTNANNNFSAGQTITGTLQATTLSGSGADLTSGTVPNAALVTSPITSIVAGSNIIVTPGTGSTPVPTVAVTAAPTFSGTVTAPYFSGSGALLSSGSIPSAALANDTISGVTLGSDLYSLSPGTHLSGGSYDGSGAVTLSTDATNADTDSTIVARDSAGDFSAGTITATLNGNASTATTATNATNLTTTDNTSSNATYYPVFQAGDSGTNPLETSSTKLEYNPSTGIFSATEFNGSGAGLSSATIPNAALVTAPVTSLTCSVNIVCGSGTTPTVQVTAAPNFSGTVTVGNLIDSGVTANSLVYANGSQQLAAASIGTGLSLSSGSLALSIPVTVADGGLGLTSATTGCLGYSGSAYNHGNCLDTAGHGITISGTTAAVDGCGNAVCLTSRNAPLCFVSGTVATGTAGEQCPGWVPENLSGASINTLTSYCATADDGDTVWTVYQNGSSVATMTLSTSNVTTKSVSFDLVNGDDYSAAITTAGTGAYCTLLMSGTEELQ